MERLSSCTGLKVVVKNTFLSVESGEEDDACASGGRRRSKTVSLFSGLHAELGEELSDSEASTRATGDGDDDDASPEATPARSCGCEGQVWALSRDLAGSRRVQAALELASDDLREALAWELRGHVAEAARCPAGNFVLQKCVGVLHPTALQFLADELLQEDVVLLARHKFGCRVLQRLLEKAAPSQVRPLVDEVIAHLGLVAQHAYGNYVVQTLIERGTDEGQRRRLFQAVEASIGSMCKNDFSALVVSACMSKGPVDVQHRLASAILKEEGLLVSAARMRFGHRVVLQVLQIAGGHELERARGNLAAQMHVLLRSKNGQAVASQL